MNKSKLIVASAFLLWGSLNSIAAPCPADHCSKVAPKVYKACMKDGNKGSAYFEHPGSDDMCSCPCSCFAVGTTVTTASGQIDFSKLESGDKVVTESGLGVINEVKKSEVQNHPVVAISFSNGITHTVSLNHPFLREGSIVTEAERLKKDDKVLGEKGEILEITAIKKSDNYTGPLYNLVLQGNDESGKDKIYYSRGIATGDWAVQSYRDLLQTEIGLRELMEKSK